MNTRALLFSAFALTMLSGCTNGPRPAPPPPGQEASIPFLNHRGIDNWAADGTETLYIQDAFRRWYRAKLFSRCVDLPYAEAIGFETRGNDTFDRFGTIIVRGQRCSIESLVTSGPPPRKLKKHKYTSEADKALPAR